VFLDFCEEPPIFNLFLKCCFGLWINGTINPILGPIVRQLLSLYFRFYKVTMFENTNATGERRM
jgi:hypothetical protein